MAFQIPAYTDFTAMFPELVTKVSEATFNFWMTQSDPFFDQCRWDDLYFIGVLYWVAHSATVGQINASGGGLFDDAIMKKVGDVQKQRSSDLIRMQAEDPYTRTLYGQQYLYYADLVGMGGVAV